MGISKGVGRYEMDRAKNLAGHKESRTYDQTSGHLIFDHIGNTRRPGRLFLWHVKCNMFFARPDNIVLLIINTRLSI